MGCTREIERCRSVHACCRQHLIDMLKFVDGFLKKHDIKYWLAYGTLLGAVRDGKMIPWDEDIDLGIEIDDAREVLKHLPELYEAGYSFAISMMSDGKICSINIFCSKTNSLHITLDISEETTDLYLGECISGIQFPGCYWPKDDIEKLIEIEFEGRMYPAPTNPEFGLSVYYSRDWKIPQAKKWIKDMILADPNADPEVLRQLGDIEEYAMEIGHRRKGFMDHNPEGPNRDI